MTNIQAWAFLVGCNQYLDYRTIVAPSFMCELKMSSLLAKAAGGDLTDIGTAYYRKVHNSKVGEITLVFCVIETTSENTAVVTDEPEVTEVENLENLADEKEAE